MQLRHIERGTRLQIRPVSNQGVDDEVYEALFHDVHDLVKETSFVVQCSRLNRNYLQIGRNTVLEVSFTKGPEVYTFTGRVISKMYSDMVIIEQVAEIMTLNRRIYQRDEIRVEVKVYGLPEDMCNERRFVQPVSKPLLSDVSFDISAGGMCIVTNVVLKSDCDPYYLLEFSLSSKDQFLLPSIAVRKSNFARSRIGKFDYGFQFIFDNMPDEKSRLTKSILSKKLSYIKS